MTEPTPQDLRARGGLKWTGHDEGVLPAWVAEMDFGLAPAVSAALHDAVDRGDTAYFYPDAEARVAEAATSFWAERFAWKVEPDSVFSVPDVVEGIRRAIVHLTEPEAPVVLHTPVYHPFFSMVERAGRGLVEVPSIRDESGRYRLDLDRIARAFEEGAGSIVLCNPWNPVGQCFSTEEISDLLQLASGRRARVIADEVHAPLIYEGRRHNPAAALDPDLVVTVTSASKAWNLPGLKAAQMVLTNPADIERWSSYYTSDKVGVGTFGLIANAAAYAEGGEWLDQVISRLADNRALLGRLFSEQLPEVGYAEPEATYLAWLDFSAFGLTEPAAYLLEEAAVALTEGAPFGAGGKGHARLNFATTRPVLTGIVDRIAGVL